MPARTPPEPKRYRLNVGLSYQTAPDIVARHARGDIRDGDRDFAVRREAGEIVSDIPAYSLPWLLDQNLIEEVPADG